MMADPDNTAPIRREQESQTVDPHSRTFRQIKDWADRRIASSRATIDARGIDQRDADFERGRISAMRDLLALGKTDLG